MMAHFVREIRIPVERPVGTLCQPGDRACPDTIEYFVLEEWSDWTIRHPTSGRMVVKEVWHANYAVMNHWLRTGEFYRLSQQRKRI